MSPTSPPEAGRSTAVWKAVRIALAGVLCLPALYLLAYVVLAAPSDEKEWDTSGGMIAVRAHRMRIGGPHVIWIPAAMLESVIRRTPILLIGPEGFVLIR